MTDNSLDPSPRTQRTRRDILAAAIHCWAADSAASLGALASSAGIGRTTLNRYFTDRRALIAAVDEECRERFVVAAKRARPDEGPGLDVLQRLCVQIVELGDVLGLIFADNPIVDPDSWTSSGGAEDPLQSAVRQGQRDGSIAADLPESWLVTLAWSSLFAAWLALRSENATRHEIALLMTRTLTRGVQP